MHFIIWLLRLTLLATPSSVATNTDDEQPGRGLPPARRTIRFGWWSGFT